MTSTRGTSAARAGREPRPADVYVGQTFRTLQLQAGPRPFAVVVVHTDVDRVSGWLMPDPRTDGADPLLKELGIQAADRLRPCYITVPVDLLK